MDRTLLEKLLNSYVDGALLVDERNRLEQMLLESAEAQELFWRRVQLHGVIRECYEARLGQHIANSANRTLVESLEPMHALRGADPSSGRHVPIGVETKTLANWPVSSYLGSVGSAWQGTVGFFSSGWPVAYLVATVIFGIGLLIGSLMPASRPQQIARQSSLPSRAVAEPNMEPVGRITGMVDCQWADPSTEVMPGTHVPLGRKYALASGLMEITYDTGAKVILQGPVTYEVESKNGGFLPAGKLTGKVEYAMAKGFTVHTPTATVTDLGTEFGVEVSKGGHTISYVFRGSVKVQVASDGGEAGAVVQVLHENQSARIDSRGAKRITMLGPSANPAAFVREIPSRTSKTFDLVDVVAGGDGYSGRRNRGIDPLSGRITDTQPKRPDNPKDYVFGDGRYHRVAAIPFVDGVFVPDSRRGPVQVDSAGHTYDDFGVSDNSVFTCIWAGAIPIVGRPVTIPTEMGGIDYASSGHGLLFLHANKGITFALAAIRRANPGCKLLRFRAVAGNTETLSEKGKPVSADLWVLVDGETRFRRRGVNSSHGAYPVVIPIVENDRFLTLVATDGGNGVAADWIMFGDPRLELLPVKTDSAEGPTQH